LFVAPSSSVHRIQEAQTTIYQVLWELSLAALANLRDEEVVSHVPRHTR
jgi:D-sedoheptulose 7-phosphate isomerase